MADDEARDVPEGAAVLPLIPPELGVHPLLLAALHALVFLDGSDDEVVDPEAAGEALEYMAGYFQRLQGDDLRRLREDVECLAAYARQQGWPKQTARFFKDFVKEYGIGGEGEEG
jgi:hypothetical protein